MRIKYSPIKWNPYVHFDALPDTVIAIIDANALSIDGEEYSFDTESIQFENLHEITNGYINDAYRDETGELYITVRRFYTESCQEWDTGDYHVING